MSEIADLRGRGAVVTGAGTGIGRALASELAARGARLVLTDVDTAALADVAGLVDAVAVPGDLRDPSFCTRLVQEASDTLGGVDVFFSNAGVDTGTGPDAPDAVWESVLDINLLAHVRLVRELVPRWAEAGAGHLVVTASAAGLLTMVDNAPYAVSKHAVVAYAEWLSIEHGAQGITVQALCPQGVNTRMLQESGPARELLSHDGALEPDDVARHTLDALGRGQFLILPHPQVADYYRARATETDRWLGGMRRVRRQVFGG